MEDSSGKLVGEEDGVPQTKTKTGQQIQAIHEANSPQITATNINTGKQIQIPENSGKCEEHAKNKNENQQCSDEPRRRTPYGVSSPPSGASNQKEITPFGQDLVGLQSVAGEFQEYQEDCSNLAPKSSNLKSNISPLLHSNATGNEEVTGASPIFQLKDPNNNHSTGLESTLGGNSTKLQVNKVSNFEFLQGTAQVQNQQYQQKNQTPAAPKAYIPPSNAFPTISNNFSRYNPKAISCSTDLNNSSLPNTHINMISPVHNFKVQTAYTNSQTNPENYKTPSDGKIVDTANFLNQNVSTKTQTIPAKIQSYSATLKNHPPPPTTIQTLASKLRARQASTTPTIQLQPPKRHIMLET